ncbi:2,5-dioxovalerate dehydrogenase [Novosphingobium sp. AAP83]|uniref:aldehyde dehydrogenase (NADP(+)) n=1 Tax=Novosphingobium sp. AAP83 TaxID=1523425 RepID=UPI0006B95E1F|nr:aldehyde dehydrogenase (NADP(+)) [Novosphingobium sp. AAP83]KPF88577.1 2,5-dioxovalerate dehydrogenase [Novosphingobium sp. AAP83]
MEVRGELLIGAQCAAGAGPAFRAFNPTLMQEIAPEFKAATLADVERACALASAAFEPYRHIGAALRAAFLETIASNIEANAEAIVACAMAETGLPEVRCRGELGRTTGQLRLFARTVRDGAYLDARIDPALPDRTPPRADIRMVQQPLGPIVVFGASNFPLAFSVAGGDTASALAAGCPVIVKGHSAHPGTSELVGRTIQQAVIQHNLPEGVFSLLFGDGSTIGTALVANPCVRAVGFTGSRNGGLALMAVAQNRPRPIPVYAEMSSINPVILLPGALGARAEQIGAAFAASSLQGAGQFCTNPGLLLAVDGPDLDRFVASAVDGLEVASLPTMLTPGIHQAYRAGVQRLSTSDGVKTLRRGGGGEGIVCDPALFETDADCFMSNPSLSEEVFGAAALLVRCRDTPQMLAVIKGLEGQLTIAIHADAADTVLARQLLPLAEACAGRVLFNGFGTGVEVCDAMVHGGPFPSTSDGRTTSVGSLAIARFLRPVCYQDVPAELLPEALRDDNPACVPRLIDGKR